jgi:signal transduction histidine kinase
MKRLANLWPNSIVGRTLFVLVLGLLLSHLLLFAIHYGNRQELLSRLGGQEMAERIAATVIALDEASPIERPVLIRSLNRPGFRLLWSREALAKDEPKGDLAQSMDKLLRASLGKEIILKIGKLEGQSGMMGPMHSGRSAGPGRSTHMILSLRLSDGSWVNFAIPSPEGRPEAELHPEFILALLLVTLSALGITIWAVRRATRPLAELAAASERLGRDVGAPPLPENGPSEVRQAASAFNEMQRRLKRFLDDRTYMLAAISHDLRTPITRMRLRAEFVEEEETRDKMLADLAEMEAMVASSLEFARDAASQEAALDLDLAALLQNLAEEHQEAGKAVEFQASASAPFMGRALLLKRGIGNLIENAVKYGKTARIELTSHHADYEIRIEDDGPGIPETELEAAFAPFYRLDPSRSRETGGMGLGLAVARNAARAHGGDVVLKNRPEGGLCAVVRLPVLSKSKA